MVSHALPPTRRVQVAAAWNTQLFEAMFGMYCNITYKDGQEPGLLVKIYFDFYIAITPHMLVTDLAVIGTAGVW